MSKTSKQIKAALEKWWKSQESTKDTDLEDAVVISKVMEELPKLIAELEAHERLVKSLKTTGYKSDKDSVYLMNHALTQLDSDLAKIE